VPTANHRRTPVSDLPSLRTQRLTLRLPDPGEAQAVLDYIHRNRDFHRDSDPMRPGTYTTVGFWERQLTMNREEALVGRSFRFFLFQGTDIVGVANLSFIRRGAMQAASLGYALDKDAEGKGLMAEALQAVIAFAFDDLGLHRIEADHLPENERSAKVLARLGFRIEGYAERFLLMRDGQWHDHVRTALVRTP